MSEPIRPWLEAKSHRAVFETVFGLNSRRRIVREKSKIPRASIAALRFYPNDFIERVFDKISYFQPLVSVVVCIGLSSRSVLDVTHTIRPAADLPLMKHL